MLTILAGLSALGTAVATGYYVAAIAAAQRFARRKNLAPPELRRVPPRVALLKPLHRAGSQLAANLETFLAADYPQCQYVLGVSGGDSDPAEVAREFIARHPQVEIALETTQASDAANNKIAKLIRMAERAPDAEVFVLSDADIVVDRDYLERLVAELYADELTGMVTCAYRSRPGSGDLGARLEALYVNADFLPMTLLANAIEPLSYGFGATIAIKRQALEQIGGFQAVKDLLADDYYLGNLTFGQGFRIHLSGKLVTSVSREKSLSDFLTHQMRWARTYRSVRISSVAMVMTYGPFWALLLTLCAGLSPLSCIWFGAVVGLRCAMAAYVMRRVAEIPVRMPDLALLPIKDLLNVGIWAASLLGNTVTWGGRRFRILPDGRLEEIGGLGAEARPASAPAGRTAGEG